MIKWFTFFSGFITERAYMDNNFRTFTLLLAFITHGMIQGYEYSEFNNAPSEIKQQVINNLPAQKIPTQCRKLSPVVDIWALVPLLTKKGLIKQSMSRDEKRNIIQEYIKNKNLQYQKCTKKTKPRSGIIYDLDKGSDKKCNKPVMTFDEDKLEVLLIKEKLIDESMTKQQKHDVIDVYKNKRMEQYLSCKMKSK